MNIPLVLLIICCVLLLATMIFLFVKRKSIKLKLLEEQAEKGNADTQLALGLMLYSGVQIDENKNKGKEYIKKAAENGSAQAQFLYSGIILENKENLTKPELMEAARWIEKSAENGCMQGIVTLANMYADGKILQKNPEKSLYWFTQAAERGDVTSQVTVAGVYHFSMGKDKAVAYAWYKVASEAGNEYAKDTAEKLYNELTEREKEDADKKADEFISKYLRPSVH